MRNYLEEKIQQIGFKYIYEEELNHEMHFKYKRCQSILEVLESINEKSVTLCYPLLSYPKL